MNLIFQKTNEKERIAQMAEFYPINLDTPYKKLVGHLSTSTEEYLLPLLGDSYYNELVDALIVEESGGTALTSTNKMVLEYARYGLMNYMIGSNAASISVQLGGSGIFTQNNENVAGATQTQIKAMTAEAMRTAEMYAQKLLKYMLANKGTLTTWAGSSGYAENNDGLLNDAKIFGDMTATMVSYFTWAAVKPSVRIAEETEVQGLLGEATYDALLTKVTTGTSLTLWEKTLLKYCHSLAANAALYEALPAMNARIGSQGIFVPYITDGVDRKDSVTQTQLQNLLALHKRRADAAARQITDYLFSHAEYFPTYPKPEVVTPRIHDNRGKKSFFA